jgi:hypothetical protein
MPDGTLLEQVHPPVELNVEPAQRGAGVPRYQSGRVQPIVLVGLLAVDENPNEPLQAGQIYFALAQTKPIVKGQIRLRAYMWHG